MEDIYGDEINDEIEYGLGAIWPMPGGLKDHIQWFLGHEEFVKVIGGEKKLYKYLDENAKDIAQGNMPFSFIDALNCEDGCLCGTATDKTLLGDEALFNLFGIREGISTEERSAWSKNLTAAERLELLDEKFAGLNVDDYVREYTDRSEDGDYFKPNKLDLEYVFASMRKETIESREINCSSCGYDTCEEMAQAIINGFNHKENCVYYLKHVLEEEHERLEYVVTHDDLLMIWNRRKALEVLRKNMTLDKKYSIVMAGLDGFKGINETYGTLVADKVLRAMARRMRNIALANHWIFARYHGDVFLLAIEGEHIEEDSNALRQMKAIFAGNIDMSGHVVSLEASFGIANSDGETVVDRNIVNAEEALFEAKLKGRNQVFVYSDKMKEKEREEKRISEKLNEAFDNDGFFMLYQPQIDTQTKELCGMEALVRMKEPGMYPGQFIPVAEKNGWIWRIGRITTKLVVQQLGKWLEEGRDVVPVSVNYSSMQLSDKGYVGYVKRLLDEYNVPAKYLEIEITEGIFMDNNSAATKLFEELKGLGIRLLMDDFGTGYSSLGYLTYIPVDVIKLDKSLVDTYLIDGKEDFIKHVIQLVHDLDKEMIIEGVEEEWQYEKLKVFGADAIQGYYFSKPIDPDEAIVFEVA